MKGFFDAELRSLLAMLTILSITQASMRYCWCKRICILFHCSHAAGRSLGLGNSSFGSRLSVSACLEWNEKAPTCPFPTSVVSIQYQKCIRCYAKRDLSFLSRKRNAFAICISELLSCPSMLYVFCLKYVIGSRGHCSLADVGLSPTNMDYVKVGSELTRIC